MAATPFLNLNSYLAAHAGAGELATPSRFVADGASQLTPADLAALAGLLPQVRLKCEQITDSERLRHRLELLLRYYEETARSGGGPERSEIAFTLYYFLKGYDLIPDSVPAIGLLDDALLVAAVLERHGVALRAHWVRQARAWPENL